MGVQSSWADEVTTFNFSGQTINSTPTLSGTNHHKAANAQQVQVAVDPIFGGYFAFQSVGEGNGFYYTTTQLVQFKGDRYFSILNLEAGDKIVFTFSTANASSVTDKHFTVENCGTGSTTNLSLTAGGSAITANTDMVSGTAYYVLADGYVDFKTRKNVYFDKVVITKANSSLPNMSRVWGQSFRSLGKEIQTEITTDGGACSNGKAVAGDANNYYPSADDGTTAFTTQNVGFYVAYNSKLNHRRWKLYNGTNGIYNITHATADAHIYNLVKGQIVKVNGSALYEGSGTLTKLSAYDGTNTRYYQVNANGTGVLTVDKQKYIYSIEVFNTDNEIVGLMDKSSGFAAWVGSGIDVPKDGAVLLQFKNHGTNTQNYYNWCLGINNASDGFLCNIRADWASLDAGGAFTYQYASSADGGDIAGSVNWDDFKSDLQDADVSLNLTYKNGKLYITGTTTKGDNVYYYNYTYGDGSYNEAKWIVHPFVEKAWLEITSNAATTVRTAPVHATAISAGTIGDKGYSTFASTLYPLDLSVISGATAYYAESVGVDAVTFKSSAASVPAGEGLLLKGSAGDAVTINIADEGSAIAGNKMVGCLTEQTITSGTTNYANFYVLVNGATNAEFQNIKDYIDTNTSLTIPAGKAYLDATASLAPSLNIVFEDGSETTGINAVKGAEFTVNGEYYDLQGRRVAQPTKGLYIVNGRKVVIK